MSKKIDPAIKALKILFRGCRESPPEMLKANIEYIIGKFLTRDQFHSLRIVFRAAQGGKEG